MAGGLGLFLYGMTILSSGLEKASGGLMEKVLAKMTGNVFSGILFGALVTAAVQSSSATTVIVVGLVNAGLLKLKGAVGIIMGANIGTTMTTQILRLTNLEGDSSGPAILQLCKPSNFSSILIVIGLIIIMVGKKNKTKNVGEIMMGIGILFTGMILTAGEDRSAGNSFRSSSSFLQCLKTLFWAYWWVRYSRLSYSHQPLL